MSDLTETIAYLRAQFAHYDSLPLPPDTKAQFDGMHASFEALSVFAQAGHAEAATKLYDLAAELRKLKKTGTEQAPTLWRDAPAALRAAVPAGPREVSNDRLLYQPGTYKVALTETEMQFVFDQRAVSEFGFTKLSVLNYGGIRVLDWKGKHSSRRLILKEHWPECAEIFSRFRDASHSKLFELSYKRTIALFAAFKTLNDHIPINKALSKTHSVGDQEITVRHKTDELERMGFDPFVYSWTPVQLLGPDGQKKSYQVQVHPQTLDASPEIPQQRFLITLICRITVGEGDKQHMLYLHRAGPFVLISHQEVVGDCHNFELLSYPDSQATITDLATKTLSEVLAKRGRKSLILCRYATGSPYYVSLAGFPDTVRPELIKLRAASSPNWREEKVPADAWVDNSGERPELVIRQSVEMLAYLGVSENAASQESSVLPLLTFDQARVIGRKVFLLKDDKVDPYFLLEYPGGISVVVILAQRKGFASKPLLFFVRGDQKEKLKAAFDSPSSFQPDTNRKNFDRFTRLVNDSIFDSGRTNRPPDMWEKRLQAESEVSEWGDVGAALPKGGSVPLMLKLPHDPALLAQLGYRVEAKPVVPLQTQVTRDGDFLVLSGAEILGWVDLSDLPDDPCKVILLSAGGILIKYTQHLDGKNENVGLFVSPESAVAVREIFLGRRGTAFDFQDSMKFTGIGLVSPDKPEEFERFTSGIESPTNSQGSFEPTEAWARGVTVRIKDDPFVLKLLGYQKSVEPLHPLGTYIFSEGIKEDEFFDEGPVCTTRLWIVNYAGIRVVFVSTIGRGSQSLDFGPPDAIVLNQKGQKAILPLLEAAKKSAGGSAPSRLFRLTGDQYHRLFTGAEKILGNPDFIVRSPQAHVNLQTGELQVNLTVDELERIGYAASEIPQARPVVPVQTQVTQEGDYLVFQGAEILGWLIQPGVGGREPIKHVILRLSGVLVQFSIGVGRPEGGAFTKPSVAPVIEKYFMGQRGTGKDLNQIVPAVEALMAGTIFFKPGILEQVYVDNPSGLIHPDPFEPTEAWAQKFQVRLKNDPDILKLVGYEQKVLSKPEPSAAFVTFEPDGHLLIKNPRFIGARLHHDLASHVISILVFLEFQGIYQVANYHFLPDKGLLDFQHGTVRRELIPALTDQLRGFASVQWENFAGFLERVEASLVKASDNPGGTTLGNSAPMFYVPADAKIAHLEQPIRNFCSHAELRIPSNPKELDVLGYTGPRPEVTVQKMKVGSEGSWDRVHGRLERHLLLKAKPFGFIHLGLVAYNGMLCFMTAGAEYGMTRQHLIPKHLQHDYRRVFLKLPRVVEGKAALAVMDQLEALNHHFNSEWPADIAKQTSDFFEPGADVHHGMAAQDLFAGTIVKLPRDHELRRYLGWGSDLVEPSSSKTKGPQYAPGTYSIGSLLRSGSYYFSASLKDEGRVVVEMVEFGGIWAVIERYSDSGEEHNYLLTKEAAAKVLARFQFWKMLSTKQPTPITPARMKEFQALATRAGTGRFALLEDPARLVITVRERGQLEALGFDPVSFPCCAIEYKNPEGKVQPVFWQVPGNSRKETLTASYSLVMGDETPEGISYRAGPFTAFYSTDEGRLVCEAPSYTMAGKPLVPGPHFFQGTRIVVPADEKEFPLLPLKDVENPEPDFVVLYEAGPFIVTGNIRGDSFTIIPRAQSLAIRQRRQLGDYLEVINNPEFVPGSGLKLFPLAQGADLVVPVGQLNPKILALHTVHKPEGASPAWEIHRAQVLGQKDLDLRGLRLERRANGDFLVYQRTDTVRRCLEGEVEVASPVENRPPALIQKKGEPLPESPLAKAVDSLRELGIVVSLQTREIIRDRHEVVLEYQNRDYVVQWPGVLKKGGTVSLSFGADRRDYVLAGAGPHFTLELNGKPVGTFAKISETSFTFEITGHLSASLQIRPEEVLEGVRVSGATVQSLTSLLPHLPYGDEIFRRLQGNPGFFGQVSSAWRFDDFVFEMVPPAFDGEWIEIESHPPPVVVPDLPAEPTVIAAEVPPPVPDPTYEEQLIDDVIRIRWDKDGDVIHLVSVEKYVDGNWQIVKGAIRSFPTSVVMTVTLPEKVCRMRWNGTQWSVEFESMVKLPVGAHRVRPEMEAVEGARSAPLPSHLILITDPIALLPRPGEDKIDLINVRQPWAEYAPLPFAPGSEDIFYPTAETLLAMNQTLVPGQVIEAVFIGARTGTKTVVQLIAEKSGLKPLVASDDVLNVQENGKTRRLLKTTGGPREIFRSIPDDTPFVFEPLFPGSHLTCLVNLSHASHRQVSTCLSQSRKLFAEYLRLLPASLWRHHDKFYLGRFASADDAEHVLHELTAGGRATGRQVRLEALVEGGGVVLDGLVVDEVDPVDGVDKGTRFVLVRHRDDVVSRPALYFLEKKIENAKVFQVIMLPEAQVMLLPTTLDQIAPLKPWPAIENMLKAAAQAPLEERAVSEGKHLSHPQILKTPIVIAGSLPEAAADAVPYAVRESNFRPLETVETLSPEIVENWFSGSGHQFQILPESIEALSQAQRRLVLKLRQLPLNKRQDALSEEKFIEVWLINGHGVHLQMKLKPVPYGAKAGGNYLWAPMADSHGSVGLRLVGPGAQGFAQIKPQALYSRSGGPENFRIELGDRVIKLNWLRLLHESGRKTSSPWLSLYDATEHPSSEDPLYEKFDNPRTRAIESGARLKRLARFAEEGDEAFAFLKNDAGFYWLQEKEEGGLSGRTGREIKFPHFETKILPDRRFEIQMPDTLTLLTRHEWIDAVWREDTFLVSRLNDEELLLTGDRGRFVVGFEGDLKSGLVPKIREIRDYETWLKNFYSPPEWPVTYEVERVRTETATYGRGRVEDVSNEYPGRSVHRYHLNVSDAGFRARTVFDVEMKDGRPLCLLPESWKIIGGKEDENLLDLQNVSVEVVAASGLPQHFPHEYPKFEALEEGAVRLILRHRPPSLVDAYGRTHLMNIDLKMGEDGPQVTRFRYQRSPKNPAQAFLPSETAHPFYWSNRDGRVHFPGYLTYSETKEVASVTREVKLVLYSDHSPSRRELSWTMKKGWADWEIDAASVRILDYMHRRPLLPEQQLTVRSSTRNGKQAIRIGAYPMQIDFMLEKDGTISLEEHLSFVGTIPKSQFLYFDAEVAQAQQAGKLFELSYGISHENSRPLEVVDENYSGQRWMKNQLDKPWVRAAFGNDCERNLRRMWWLGCLEGVCRYESTVKKEQIPALADLILKEETAGMTGKPKSAAAASSDDKMTAQEMAMVKAAQQAFFDRDDSEDVLAEARRLLASRQAEKRKVGYVLQNMVNQGDDVVQATPEQVSALDIAGIDGRIRSMFRAGPGVVDPYLLSEKSLVKWWKRLVHDGKADFIPGFKSSPLVDTALGKAMMMGLMTFVGLKRDEEEPADDSLIRRFAGDLLRGAGHLYEQRDEKAAEQLVGRVLHLVSDDALDWAEREEAMLRAVSPAYVMHPETVELLNEWWPVLAYVENPEARARLLRVLLRGRLPDLEKQIIERALERHRLPKEAAKRKNISTEAARSFWGVKSWLGANNPTGPTGQTGPISPTRPLGATNSNPTTTTACHHAPNSLTNRLWQPPTRSALPFSFSKASGPIFRAF